jgi:hypothetical protein
MIAGVSAQFYPTGMMGGMGGGYPASYGMSTGYGYGSGFGGFGGFGGYGGYGGYSDTGRDCRKGVTSDDLNGYSRCNCDKNHRDEDFCNADKADFTTGPCIQGDGEGFDPDTPLSGEIPYEVFKALDDYYDEFYDEDCVERSSIPANVRRCRKGVYSKDLPGSAHCWCDQSHKKDVDDLEDLDDCDVLDAVGTAGISVDEEFWVAMHYEFDERMSRLPATLQPLAKKTQARTSRSTTPTASTASKEDTEDTADTADTAATA